MAVIRRLAYVPHIHKHLGHDAIANLLDAPRRRLKQLPIGCGGYVYEP
jgi:hypothetical protein